MFRRRNKYSPFHRMRNFFWPRAGWHRSTRYVFHRVARIPGSSYSLAAGFACGAAVSFTPLIGFHFIIAAFLAYVIRANVIASAIGTFVGNPWTFPLIWVMIYELGGILTTGSPTAPHQLNFLHVLTESMEAVYALDMRYLGETAWPILFPMLVGSVPLALIVWVTTYLVLRPMIAKYQAARYHRRTRKLRIREMARRAKADDDNDFTNQDDWNIGS